MRTHSDSISRLRVLMRMPDLSSGAATATTPERETFEQKPLAPLSSALPKDMPKSKPARQNITPEELQTSGKFARALKVLAGLAVAGVVAAALSNRGRQPSPSPTLPDKTTVESAPSGVPGGSPTQITQAPEISFPEETPPASDVDELAIKRLPPVETGPDGATRDMAIAQASDGNAAGQVLAQKPGVTHLDRSIEPSKH